MVDQEEWMDARSLWKEGHTIRAICRLTGMSRNTVRGVIRSDGPRAYERKPGVTKLTPFEDYVRGRWEESALSGVRILEEIRGMGYAGSVQTLRRFLSRFRGERRRETRLTVRFETPPGKQAQADWAYCGRFEDAFGRVIPIYAFVVILGYSRMRFVRFTTSMTIPFLIESQMAAFDYFGGAPEEVLYDNMKQVKLAAGQFHPLFLDFARTEGFEIRTHRVRRPRTKGKVERSVFFVRDNFLNGRSFRDVDDLNSQALAWADRVNGAVHGTTGRIPMELLPEEKLLKIVPYRVVERTPRRAGFDGFVAYRRSKYSVPPEVAGREVMIEDSGRTIRIRLGDMIVTEHEVAPRPAMEIAHPEHVTAMWSLTLAIANRKSPIPSWKLTFQDEVETRPLSVYEGTL